MPPPSPLRHAAQVSGGPRSCQARRDRGREPLFLLNRYAKRVHLFGLPSNAHAFDMSGPDLDKFEKNTAKLKAIAVKQ